MEYVQLTLDDWMEIKEKLRRELQGVSEGFIRIGYQLKRIREQKLYERDGYKDLASFAKQEYGLSPSVVSRFMAINSRYSVDGNSEHIRPEFAGIGSSKLGEMLTIRDEDMEMIGPDTTREGIRELKKFEKDERSSGTPVIPDRGSLLAAIAEEFFRGQPELLNKICTDGPGVKTGELVSPSGNRTFRTGMHFVSFFDADKGIKVRTFGRDKPQSFTWEEFERAMDQAFEICGADTWAKHYAPESLEKGDAGRTEPETPGPAEKQKDNRDSALVRTTASVPGDGPETPDTRDSGGEEPEEIPPEDTEVVGEGVAPAQNGLNTSAEEGPESVKAAKMTRWRYMKSLDTEKAAKYLSSHLSTSTLKNLPMLGEWLYQLVGATGERRKL